ncbi:MAG: hypothetical protein ACI9BW_002015 [Gammaproteobacteria bacterium]|jgi:hypothetical protein
MNSGVKSEDSRSASHHSATTGFHKNAAAQRRRTSHIRSSKSFDSKRKYIDSKRCMFARKKRIARSLSSGFKTSNVPLSPARAHISASSGLVASRSFIDARELYFAKNYATDCACMCAPEQVSDKRWEKCRKAAVKQSKRSRPAIKQQCCVRINKKTEREDLRAERDNHGCFTPDSIRYRT